MRFALLRGTEVRQLGHGVRQSLVGQMRVVPTCNAGVRVTEQLANGEQIHSRLSKVRSVGMAQLVEGDLRSDFRALACLREQPYVMVLAPRLAVSLHK